MFLVLPRDLPDQKFFTVSRLCWELFKGILWPILGFWFVQGSLISCELFYLMKFCTDVFFITLTFNILKKSTAVSLCGGNYAVFEPILGIFLKVLRFLKDYFDIFHSLDITAVVTKLKMCQVSLCFGYFLVFLVYFVLCSLNSKEPYSIFICMRFSFLSFFFKI